MRTQQIRFLREKLRLLERVLNDPFGQESGCCGLTLAQCHTLLEVGNRGRVSLVDLASGFGLDTSTLSRTVQGLVALGLVSRLPDEKDRRYVAISLTDQGRDLCDRIETTFNDYFGQVMEFVPAGKREAVVASIGLFSDAVKSYSEADRGCATGADPVPNAMMPK